jgi:hypothetical protein
LLGDVICEVLDNRFLASQNLDKWLDIQVRVCSSAHPSFLRLVTPAPKGFDLTLIQENLAMIGLQYPEVTVLHYERNASQETLQNLLRATYHQLLERQPYHHEKRGELAALEREFLKGKVGLKRLVRQIGQSQLYQQLFFRSGNNQRCVEQACKHFLGRAPISRSEVALYLEILVEKGFNAMIDALLDAEEYRAAFGNNTVPYPRYSFQALPPSAFLLSAYLHQSHPSAMRPMAGNPTLSLA